MALYAGIRIEYDPLIRFMKVGTLELKLGSIVVAATEYGDDIGKVVIGPVEENPAMLKTEYRIQRLASHEELERMKRNRAEEGEALKNAKRIGTEHKLPMKFLRAHYLYDRSKLLLFFFAENRVDFRDLVKDLANIFRTRIELRQISAREAVRLEGGLAACGQICCCKRFRLNFDNISMKLAKDQHLTININKISGVCGRLLCCLMYENAFYQQAVRKYPKVDSRVVVNRDALKDEGSENQGDVRGLVRDFNMIKGTVLVALETEGLVEVPLDCVKW